MKFPVYITRTQIQPFHSLCIPVFMMLCVLFGFEGHAQAYELPQPAPVVKIESVKVGTKGVYKIGMWTPVEVQFSTDQPVKLSLQLETSDSDGSPHQVSMPEVSYSKGEAQVIKGQFLPGRLSASLTVKLTQDDNVLAERLVLSSATQPGAVSVAEKLSVSLVGVVCSNFPKATEQDDELNWLDKYKATVELDENQHEQTKVVHYSDVSELPIELDQLVALDALFLADLFDLPESEDRKLRQWVQLGGHLVIFVGDQVENYNQGSISKWLPFQVEGTNSLRQLGTLENFVGKGKLPRIFLDAANIKEDKSVGVVEISSLQGPILVRAPVGFGSVSLVAIDVTKPPLNNWDGVPIFLQKTINSVQSKSKTEKSQVGRNLVHEGISTIRTQLQGSVDQFTQTQNMTIWQVMIRILGLIFLVGPLDYLLVHKIVRRPGLTWITFPLILTGMIYWTFDESLSSRSQSPLLRQVNLIDVDESSGVVRAKNWQGFYSPESGLFDFSVKPASLVAGETPKSEDYFPLAKIQWSGVPEDNFNGMYRTSGISFGQPTYEMEYQSDSMRQIPITQWSSKVYESNWVSQNAKQLIQSDLKLSAGGKLVGELTHHFPAPITNWFIAYDSNIYEFRGERNSTTILNLEPGQKWSPNDSTVFTRSLKGFLRQLNYSTEQKQAANNQDTQAKKKGYDARSVDPYQIFQAATFYNVIGGHEHYKLSNDSFQHLDMSEHMRLKRAVLFGTVEIPVCQTDVNAKFKAPDFQSTTVRIVLPVEQTYDSTKAKVILNSGRTETPATRDD